MTPKQILDSFSETLVRDERILSAQERALVANVLQHAKATTSENSETQEAVRAVIASAVGETVAQRAFAVLGGSIVDRILEGGVTAPLDSAGADIYARTPGEPQPRRVRGRMGRSSVAGACNLATPKSKILTRPSVVRNRFSGFRSR
jgi:hypothetical protein